MGCGSKLSLPAGILQPGKGMRAIAREIERMAEQRQSAARRAAMLHEKYPPEDRLKAEESLLEFLKQAWHVVEPATSYIHGWHIDAICELLEAITHGHLRNVLINVPPRSMKSLTVNVFWPAWEWIQFPERHWLFASHAFPLSLRDSVKCRRLIQSDWYQANWSHIVQLTGDQNQKNRFENTRTGCRLASSVGGSLTGENAHRVIADDPHNVKDRESERMRERVLQWWDEVMSTRLNDLKTGAKVIIMQRVHENDLSGHVLELGNYEHLCIPAEYEGSSL
jgi:hypothetical protein